VLIAFNDCLRQRFFHCVQLLGGPPFVWAQELYSKNEVQACSFSSANNGQLISYLE
jgi:hypothetical protein